jgi:hypothetical protein
MREKGTQGLLNSRAMQNLLNTGANIAGKAAMFL